MPDRYARPNRHGVVNPAHCETLAGPRCTIWVAQLGPQRWSFGFDYHLGTYGSGGGWPSVRDTYGSRESAILRAAELLVDTASPSTDSHHTATEIRDAHSITAWSRQLIAWDGAQLQQLVLAFGPRN